MAETYEKTLAFDEPVGAIDIECDAKKQQQNKMPGYLFVHCHSQKSHKRNYDIENISVAELMRSGIMI